MDDHTQEVMGHLAAIIMERRKRADLTRAKTIALLPYEIHTQTLAAYETGIRVLAMDRFLDLCAALEVSAPALLREAISRVDPATCPTCGEIR